MVKLVYCLRRLSHLSRDEFQRYWCETHGPLVRGHAPALSIRRYVQSHTLEHPLSAGLSASRGCQDDPFDGVAELWWDSAEALLAAMATDHGQSAGEELLADERRFIDHARSVLWLSEERPFVP